jgi:hypothetical protein
MYPQHVPGTARSGQVAQESAGESRRVSRGRGSRNQRLEADECLARGLLLGQGAALTFRHALVRQTILESLSPPHQMALHRMTLDALKASPATRHDLACLAHHAEAASDREAVLAYAPAAARQAAAANAHREAASLYALVLRR